MYKPGLIFFVVLSLSLAFINTDLYGSSGNYEKDSVITASVTVVGDLMCHSVQFNYARKGIDTFDFKPVYRYVKKLISSTDLAFGNFETVTAGAEKDYSGYPKFNSPDEYVDALKYAGFDLLTTSNNHSLDRGEVGIIRTIQKISSFGMGYNGTFSSQADRDSIRIYVVNGIRIAFLAFSYGTNGIEVPEEKPYLVNIIDTLLIKNDIMLAKLSKPDIILVHYHFGNEYSREYSDVQKKIVDKTIEYGADIIIGGHPHVIQPAEFLKGNHNLDSVFVIYSMGNFISNQRNRYTDAGVIVQLNINKNMTSGKVSLDSVNITPTWVYKGRTRNGNEYVILPYGTEDFGEIEFSKEDGIKLNQAFEDTKNMLMTDKRIRLRP